MSRFALNPGDLPLGALPADLLAGWPFTASFTATVVADATAPHGKVIRITPLSNPPAPGQDFAVLWLTPGSVATPGLVALVRPNAGATLQWSGIVARASLTVEQGYSTVLRTNTPDVRIEERPSPGAGLAQQSLAVGFGTWTWLRQDIVEAGASDTIRSKAWLGTDPAAEPASWTLEGSDSTYAAAGHVGFFAQFGTVGGSFDLAWMGLATAGEQPPKAPAGTPVITAPTARQNAPSPITVAWTGDAAATFEGEVQVDGGAWTSLFTPQSAMSYEWAAPADTRGHPVKVRVREVSPVGPWAESPTFYVSIWSDAGPAGTAITWTPVE